MPRTLTNSVGPTGIPYLAPNTLVIGASPQATRSGGLIYLAGGVPVRMTSDYVGELPGTNIPPTLIGTPEILPYGQTIPIRGVTCQAAGDYLGDQPWTNIHKWCLCSHLPRRGQMFQHTITRGQYQFMGSRIRCHIMQKLCLLGQLGLFCCKLLTTRLREPLDHS